MPYIMKKTGGKYPLFSDGSGGFNQPWKEVPEPPSPFLLDTVGDAYIAVSMRKLKSDATLCMRVERSSDKTQQDIGFDGPYIDLQSLLNFTGTFSANVVRWYDQSGNNRHISRVSSSAGGVIVPGDRLNGPRIVENGIVASQSALIGPDFKYTGSTSSTALRFTQSAYGLTQTFYFGVVRGVNTTSNMVIYDAFEPGTPAGGRHLFYQISSTTGQIWDVNNSISFTGIPMPNNTLYNYGIKLKANDYKYYYNVATGSTTYTNTSKSNHSSNRGFSLGDLQVGDFNQTFLWKGIIAEKLIFERNLTDSEMTTIQDNQETYYNI